MNILGIESSCDETSAAVVRNGKEVLSNVTVSSLRAHQKYGGIIPEIASRRQLEVIHAIVQAALHDAKLTFAQIDAIAVTQNPGLIGSLLVGLSFARALSYALKKPLIEVNHIQAHLYANFLKIPLKSSGKQKSDKIRQPFPKLPAVGLIVSGGHTSLYYLKDFQHFQLMGQTLDDAAGEAFDKVARILNLGYPGGPVIDRIARTTPKPKLHFPPAALPGNFNFSFSGLKTAVLYYQQKHKPASKEKLSEIVSAFQESVVSILIKKSIAACQAKRVRVLLVGGGVAANSALREKLSQEARQNDIQVFVPDLSLCLDNAAMIAGYGFHLISPKGKRPKNAF